MALASPLKTPEQASPAVGYTSLWDARPRKFKSVLFEVTLFILVMELSERLSYYAINQGLKNFMQKIGWSLVSSSALKSTWTSICFVTPLFGAYMADERWGRFKTILVFGIWYCIGDFLVAIAAYPSIMENKAVVNPIFIIGLFVGIAVGTGAIKSSVITMGADQFDPNDPSEQHQKDTYFNYFYLCINIGAAFSYGYISVLSVDGSSLIPKEYGYFASFLIGAVVMAIAILAFLVGSPRYVYVPPTDKSISTFLQLIWANARATRKGFILVASTALLFFSLFVNIAAAFTTEVGRTGEVFSWIAGAMVLLGIIGWVYVGHDQSFLDASKISNGGEFTEESVDDYKKMISVLPYASYMIIWWCAYDQTDANFQSITQQCDLRLDRSDPDSKQIPGATLGVFDPIFIVVFIPILDSIVYPLVERINGRAPSQFTRTAVGLFIAAIGLFWAGIFEVIRRNAGPLRDDTGAYILDGGSDQPMNNVSWGLATPQYMLIALAECLVNVTAYDVFYSAVPIYMKSLAMGVSMFMTSMGAIITSVFTIMFSPYLPTNNLNDGHLEYMFFTVGAVSLVNLAAFIFTMKKMDFGMKHRSHKAPELDAKVSVSRRSIAETK